MDAHARTLDEQERLAALQALEILDTEPEAAFDRITSLAATLFRVPTVLISLVDDTLGHCAGDQVIQRVAQTLGW